MPLVSLHQLLWVSPCALHPRRRAPSLRATRCYSSQGPGPGQELLQPGISEELPSLPGAGVLERDYGVLERSQYPLFVQFFRQASPYIEGHRGQTFVLAIPGEVIDQTETLHGLLEDVALLHGLGIKLVLVIGTRLQINAALRESGDEPRYAGGYRVTDAATMHAAVQAAGRARMEVEARLSKGPAVNMVRRHTRGSEQSVSYGPALQTVSGNYVSAKRKGVVGGVDYQHTGVVRFVQADAVRRQLEGGNVVLLSNLGFSASGEVLNCDAYTVACRAAMDLSAQKLIVLTMPETQPLQLPAWLPLGDAEAMLTNVAAPLLGSPAGGLGLQQPGGSSSGSSSEGEGSNGSGGSPRMGGPPEDVDFDKWAELGLPLPLLAAYTACAAGVKRAHILDARSDGALLLELYSRDGVGCMISADFYEGIRPAAPQDLAPLQDLLRPLEERGVLVKRSEEHLLQELPHFTVVEREGRVLGCAMVKPLGDNAAGEAVGELAAFCVHPSFRGSGKGDSLLEYLESDAGVKGIQRLVLLTTRTADWFEQRGFKPEGQAHTAEVLPHTRRQRIDPSRNSQLFSKQLRLVAGR